ncbi:MAG: LamG-like jellyroll fold domain-containing protein [Verrucomicrobiales bacterium]
MKTRTPALFGALLATLVLVTVPLAQAGLIGLYTFDNSADPLNDSSGSSNHLTDTAGTDPVWGAASGVNSTGAYEYSADRIISPIDVNPETLPQMTWGAWVRTNSLDAGLRKVLGHDDGAWDRTLGLDNRAPDGNFRYTSFTGNDPVNASGPVEGTPAPDSTTAWSFICAAYDQTAKTVAIYVDIDASTTADALVGVTEPAGFGAGFTTFAIGGLRPDNAAEAWDGAIDQVFVYDEALTSEKVTRIRNRGLAELQGVFSEPHSEIVHASPLFGRLEFETLPATILRSITVKHAGASGTLTVNAPVISGPNAASYTINSAPTTLAPGTQGDIVISLPGVAGTYAASIRITTNDPDSVPLDVPLDATVVDLLPSGLVGLYTFDDAGNPLNDSSGAGNHLTGTAGTNPVWGATTGYTGTGAYDFSGDRLIAPLNINPGALAQMTWGAWVRTDSLVSGLHKVLGHDNGGWDRTLGLDNREGDFRYTTFVGNGPPIAGTPTPENTTDWTFICATYDQDILTATMYVDLDAATNSDPLVVVSGPCDFNNGFNSFAIGDLRPDNSSEPWDGAIDQVFVYNKVLTDTQVKAIRDRGLRELLGIPSADPDIAVAPVNLFGDLRPLGAAPGPVTRQATISNTGATRNLVISSITVTGSDAARYSLSPPLPSAVAPQNSAVVNVVFTPPPAGGSFSATLNIASDDEDMPVATVGLNATVTTDPNAVVLHDAPLYGRLIFNAVPAAIQRTVTVKNTGVANALTVIAPVIAGANAANYSVVSVPAPIAPGAQADLVVSLAPGAAGNFAASLEFTTNDSDAGAISVPLNASVVVVAAATLEAFYCFDNEADPLRDESGMGRHITDTAGTDPVWGAASGFNNSGAYEFTDDRLIAPVDINPAVMPQMTWGAWVRTNSVAPGLRKVMGHDDGAWDRTIGLDDRNGGWRYTTFTGDNPVNASGPVEGTPGPVNTTDWTFIAATYDETALTTTFYVDLDAATTADPVLRATEPAGFGTGFTAFAIGGLRPDNAAEAWDGAIDNVFVYSGILTDEQIQTIRDQGKTAIVGPDDFFVTAFNINPNGTVTLTWNSDPGATYTLRYSFDLIGAISTWPDEADDIASGGAATTYTTGISFSGSQRVFFSVERN